MVILGIAMMTLRQRLALGAVDENSHLITMSTCITGQPNRRFIVVAVEVEE